MAHFIVTRRWHAGCCTRRSISATPLSPAHVSASPPTPQDLSASCLCHVQASVAVVATIGGLLSTLLVHCLLALVVRACLVVVRACLCFLWPLCLAGAHPCRKCIERVSVPLSFALVSCLCLLSHASVWCLSAHASLVSLSWRAARACECLQMTAYE